MRTRFREWTMRVVRRPRRVLRARWPGFRNLRWNWEGVRFLCILCVVCAIRGVHHELRVFSSSIPLHSIFWSDMFIAGKRRPIRASVKVWFDSLSSKDIARVGESRDKEAPVHDREHGAWQQHVGWKGGGGLSRAVNLGLSSCCAHVMTCALTVLSITAGAVTRSRSRGTALRRE